MGTPFIIIVLGIIVVCIAIAIVVVSLMRRNGELDAGEPGQPGRTSEALPATGNLEPHGPTGPLPPFVPLPHQTQPLSEIYYYDERLSGPLPAIPPPQTGLSDAPSSPAQAAPPNAFPPPMP